jgi:FlaG/FlaF family flagellin (archaellin)
VVVPSSQLPPKQAKTPEERMAGDIAVIKRIAIFFFLATLIGGIYEYHELSAWQQAVTQIVQQQTGTSGSLP